MKTIEKAREEIPDSADITEADFADYLRTIDDEEMKVIFNGWSFQQKKLQIHKAELERYVKANFFVDANNPQAKLTFSEQSSVGQILEQKTNPGDWATEGDILTLAEYLGIQIKFSGVGAADTNPVGDDRPLVRIHHPNDFHWTTLIDPFNNIKNIDDIALRYLDQYRIGPLTKEEISNVFKSYIRGNSAFLKFFGFNTRNHIPLARKILALCNDPSKSADELVQEIIKITPHDVNPKGHFISAVKYLAYRSNQPALLNETMRPTSSPRV